MKALAVETKMVLLIILVVLMAFLGTYVTVVVPLMDVSLSKVGKDTVDYTPLELQGKIVYQREGCINCHTQQVRNLLFDAQRYGMGEVETFKRFGIRAHIMAPPTQPGEIALDKPHQLGTRRTGPDLARVGGKYDNTWHINHFKDPRYTTPGSLMVRYTWFFDKSGKPTKDLNALVAYLQKLGTNLKWREEGVQQYTKLHEAGEKYLGEEYLKPEATGKGLVNIDGTGNIKK